MLLKVTPVCSVCSEGMLCSSCQKKMDRGEITTFDIDLTRDFLKLEQEYTFLRDVSFYRSIDYGDLALFIVGKGDKSKIEESGILATFQKKFDLDTIKVVEFSKNFKVYIENVVDPIEVLGVDQIYLPMGTSEYRVKVKLDEEDRDQLLLSPKDLEELLEELTGKVITLAFE